MPGIRALAGYMDAFVGAGEDEQDRMLQEMKQLLEVGKGLSTMQATQQATRIAGSQEARTAQMHPLEMDVKTIARNAAREALEESERVREHRAAMRVPELETARAVATTSGAGAEYAGRREAATVGDLEKRLLESNLRYEELLKSIQRGDVARRAITGRGLPTPEEAAMGAPVVKYAEDYAKMQARDEYEVAIKEASAAATAAVRKRIVDKIMIDHPEYTEDQILGGIELEAAQAAKLRADVKALEVGKDKERTRFDYLKMVADATEFLDRLDRGLSVQSAAEIWSPNSPIYVALGPYLTDKKAATDHVEQFLRVVKGILLEDFQFDYDARAAEEVAPLPEFYYQPGQAPRVPTPTTTPAPATTPAPGTFNWDVNWDRIQEGLRGGTPQ